MRNKESLKLDDETKARTNLHWVRGDLDDHESLKVSRIIRERMGTRRGKRKGLTNLSQAAAAEVGASTGGSLDVLISNAGIGDPCLDFINTEYVWTRDRKLKH